jgi:hypothetical protein
MDRSVLRSAAPVPDPTDEAGTGNQLTVRLVRHSQRKRRDTDRPNLRSMAPVLDPTGGGVNAIGVGTPLAGHRGAEGS